MTEPYYERDGITIYLGDCREVLPAMAGPFVTITDPPYNAGKNFGKLTNDRLPWAEWCDWWDGVLDLLMPISPVVLATLSQTAWRHYVRLGKYPPDWTLVWSKPLALAICALPFMPHWEPIAYWGKTMRRGGSFWGGDVLTHNVNRSRHGHPTEKPLPLLLELVAKFDPALPILDPFAGSGTTLVAAKLLARRAMGIELNADYAAIAVHRLGQTVMPLVQPSAEQSAMALESA